MFNCIAAKPDARKILFQLRTGGEVGMTNETVIAILGELKKCYLGGIVDALDFAIEAMKAQEPRVMTLEEYDAWTGLPFTERNPVFHEERTERGRVTCWVNTAVCSLREYGKNDRCWTSRPTKEQMEAAKWDD